MLRSEGVSSAGAVHPGHRFHIPPTPTVDRRHGTHLPPQGDSTHPLRARLQDALTPTHADTRPRLFKIRAAESAEQHRSASILIERRYASRGYLTSPLRQDHGANRLTLTTHDGEQTIGTLTIGFDGDRGLLADELFKDEIESLRADGHEVCEFTKLALDTVACSKRVLASLFHMAYIYGHRIKHCDTLLIEVNPRHVRYYMRMLGFEVKGPQRLNQRVNAPAVLMALNFAHAREQISRFGGNLELAAVERSLYPYFFAPSEEAGIVERLRGL